MMLEFQKEIILPEDVLVFSDQAFGSGSVTIQNGTGNFTFETATQPNQPIGMLPEGFTVNPRTIIVSFEMSDRDQLNQIKIPFVRFSQQDQMMIPLIELGALVAQAVG